MNKHMRIFVVALFLLALPVVALADGPFQFYPLSPCRVVDTRLANATNGGPILDANARTFSIRGNCGVPTTAKAVSLNVTVAKPTDKSWITMWPSNVSKPDVSTINFDATDWAIANGAITPLGTATGDLTVHNFKGTVHLILDVVGYFQ